MSRRPATLTQADIARVVRAAKQAGAATVELRVGDTEITIRLSTDDKPPLAEPHEVIL